MHRALDARILGPIACRGGDSMSPKVDGHPAFAVRQREPATRCPRCRRKAVRPRMRPGRTARFRTMKALPVPEDIPIPTCGRCGAECIDPETAALLNAVLAETYRSVLRRRARRVIDIVTGHISQRRLELLLGLSQGYLSRLRAGHSSPSPELVSHLAVLAIDPPARLHELEQFWATPEDFPADICAPS